MNALKPKVSIIGAGSVGSTFAYTLMMSGLAREIVLIDKDELRAQGECMDLNHGLSFARPAKIYAAGFEGCAESDIVVVTAGAKQIPGQTRIDLCQKNVEIFKGIIPSIVRYAPESILLVVSNPVDILTYVTMKISGFPSSKVIGSGTVLDSSRFKYLISEHCKTDPRNIHAYIIGEHGDSELPVWSNANIGGMLLEKYCLICNHLCDNKVAWDNIFEEVKTAAYKIIEAKGGTYYAIALALGRIVEAILRDENSILPVSTLINGYYGVNDVCLSIPSKVNRSGVENFLALELSDVEQKQFKHSADTLQEIIKHIQF
ncbi:MAG: L-lactate dehydrogenase [Candidatus Omnitrophica bacterium]|nr:L-lactate dehydrogenase [Candidatus Omnitrophota bacterium]